MLMSKNPTGLLRSVPTLHYAQSYTDPSSVFPLVLESVDCFMYIWVNLHFTLPIRKSAVWPHQLQFSTCVTPYINTAPHVRRHSCRQPASQHVLALCFVAVCVCVYRVKGAIHEQLAGVKAGEGRAAVYDHECIYVFVSVNVCARARPYICQCMALPDIDVVTAK